MNREILRKVLLEYAQSNMPAQETVDLWPGIRSRLVEVERARMAQQRHRTDSQSLRPLRERRLIVAGALASAVILTGVLSLFVSWTIGDTKPASASEILARASAVPNGTNATGVHSTHTIVRVRYRNSPTEDFTQGVQEWWDQAPDRSRTDSTVRVPDGKEYHFVLAKAGTTRYMYDKNRQELRIDSINRPATTVGSDVGTAAGEASSIGKFGGVYDAVLIGEEQVAGRAAYILDLTAKPNANLSIAQYRKKVWIDKEAYIMLGEQDWDKDGALLYESVCQSIEINPDLDPSIFAFKAPAGTKITDLRATPTPTSK